MKTKSATKESRLRYASVADVGPSTVAHGSGRVASQNSPSWVGRVRCQKCLINNYLHGETDYSTTIMFIMIRNCNIANRHDFIFIVTRAVRFG